MQLPILRYTEKTRGFVSARFRFGVYDLDVSSLELRKRGICVKLQEQPFRVLSALVARPGEVITRDDLKQRIWENHTFVDFDQSLNKAVNRLREVLGDNASQPRYIETVPRRGYRFVAHVDAVDLVAPVSPSASDRVSIEQKIKPGRRVSVRVLIAATLVVAAFICIALLRMNLHTAVAEPPAILVRDAFSPSISQDGKLLAYISAKNGDVPQAWARQIGGGKPIQITRGAARAYFSELSPEGTRFLVASEEQGTEVRQISVFPGDTSIPVPHAISCRFSPSGESLLCIVPQNQQRLPDTPVSVVVVSHGEQDPVSFVSGHYDISSPPVWSATGTSFLFLGRRRNEAASTYGWWLADLSSRSVRRFNLPGLMQRMNMPPSVYTWVRQNDKRMFIFYSIQDRNGWLLNRIRVSAEGRPLGAPDQVLAGAGVLNGVARESTGGTLVYSVGSLSENIFEIPIDRHGRQLGPVSELPLPEGPLYYSPSASRDGTAVAYISAELGRENALTLRDSSSGTDRILDKSGAVPRDESASLSPDGSRVVFNRWCTQKEVPDCPSFVVSAAGGHPERICDNCQARGFSRDGSWVLMQKYASRSSGSKALDEITAVDIATKQEREFLTDPNHAVYHAFLSPDNRWVVFKRWINWTKSQILIAPVNNRQAAPEPEWIPVTDGRFSDDKPQFAPDGNSVYFTSDRDGYLCIWVQRLDPVTRHPVGAVAPYAHFHNSMGRDAVSFAETQRMADLTVAADKILINLPQRRSDIWITHLN